MTYHQRRAMRIALYLFLVLSAAAAFLLGDWLRAAARQGEVPFWAPLVAPSIFTLFVGLYAVDRWLLVRRRLSSLGRALIQLAFAITFVSLLWLWPIQVAEDREAEAEAAAAPDYRLSLLGDRRAEVRASGCELLGLRGDAEVAEQMAALVAGDDSPLVREACRQALARLRAAPGSEPEAPAPSAPEPGSDPTAPSAPPGPSPGP